MAGVKVIRGKCNVTLEFEKYFMNECRIGTYECVATDATGKVIDRMKSVLHPMKISLSKCATPFKSVSFSAFTSYVSHFINFNMHQQCNCHLT